MVLNHKAAIEFLVEEAEGTECDSYTFRNLHALLSDNLLPDPGAGGRLRHMAVEISGSVFRPLAVPQQIEECFTTLLEKARAIEDPFEQALFLLVQIPYLQPFDDVNKRVSRLGANVPLIKMNLCPLTYVDVPERTYVDGLLGVYELNRIDLVRDVFVWAYERSVHLYRAVRQSLGDPDRFRLRHREVLIATLAGIVRERCPATPAEVRRRLSPDILGASDADRLIDEILGDLARIHEGNLARYRLRPSDLAAWRAAQRDEHSQRPKPRNRQR